MSRYACTRAMSWAMLIWMRAVTCAPHCVRKSRRLPFSTYSITRYIGFTVQNTPHHTCYTAAQNASEIMNSNVYSDTCIQPVIVNFYA